MSEGDVQEKKSYCYRLPFTSRVASKQACLQEVGVVFAKGKNSTRYKSKS